MFWRHVCALKTSVRSFHQLQLVHFHYVGYVDYFNNELGDSVYFRDSAICFAVVNHNNPYFASVVSVNDPPVDCYSFLTW